MSKIYRRALFIIKSSLFSSKDDIVQVRDLIYDFSEEYTDPAINDSHSMAHPRAVLTPSLLQVLTPPAPIANARACTVSPKSFAYPVRKIN